jgi:glycosyltransferase involved in cell wall biosynthesis
MPDEAGTTRIGAVIIGRNEGDRLRLCLESVAPCVERMIYVDSGSSDGSVDLARRLGADVVELAPDRPFTAARARNAGVIMLAAASPGIGLVQFIDGDCELDPGWLDVARAAMATLPGAAVICGRRRERFPDASVYNGLCDREWNTPIGEADSCGGDALMRVDAFSQAGGFAPTLIAGEEPDLCHRLRMAGWRIYRIEAEMTRHDAAITRVSQWWQRNKRSGYAGAEAWYRRGQTDPATRRPVFSNLLWALAWPLWPLLWWRVYRRSDAVYATHIVIGKVPHCQGQLRFWLDRLNGRHSKLIEYK